MNKLISFGDSFTWGSDLNDSLDSSLDNKENNEKYKKNLFDEVKIGYYDEIDHNHKITTWAAGYSRNTWPALLANKFNQKYVCYAQPGCSNQSIVRQFFQYLPYIDSDDTVVINWTWIDRWDFYRDNDNPKETWSTVRPSGTNNKISEQEKIYFKYIHHDVWAKLETLKSILLIINTLENKNIKYITTTIDKLTFDKEFHTPSYIKNLQDILENKFTWFEGDDFLTWSKKNNFKISDKWHPLEEAHIKAFEYINEITK